MEGVLLLHLTGVMWIKKHPIFFHSVIDNYGFLFAHGP